MALDSPQDNGWWGRPLWAEIDLDALAYNVASLKGQARPAGMAGGGEGDAYRPRARRRARLPPSFRGEGALAGKRRPSHRRAGAHAYRQLAGDGPRPGARGGG